MLYINVTQNKILCHITTQNPLRELMVICLTLYFTVNNKKCQF